jgi:hypothetical protein
MGRIRGTRSIRMDVSRRVQKSDQNLCISLVLQLTQSFGMTFLNLSHREHSLAYQGKVGLEIYGDYSKHLNYSVSSVPISYPTMDAFETDPGPGPYTVSDDFLGFCYFFHHDL